MHEPADYERLVDLLDEIATDSAHLTVEAMSASHFARRMPGYVKLPAPNRNALREKFADSLVQVAQRMWRAQVFMSYLDNLKERAHQVGIGLKSDLDRPKQRRKRRRNCKS